MSCKFFKKDGTCGDKPYFVCDEWLKWDKEERKAGEEAELFCENYKPEEPPEGFGMDEINEPCKNCSVRGDITPEELARLINKAADFLGTDKEYRNIGCIDVALDYAVTLRKELKELREYIENHDIDFHGG